MLSDLAKLGRQSMVYGLSTAIGRLVSLITAPILTRIFEPSDYGIIALVQLAITLAVIFAGMNLGSGLTYYYFHYDDDATRKKIVSTGFLIIILTALFISFLLYAFAPQINMLFNLRTTSDIHTEITHYLKVASLSMFFGLVMTATQSILRILEKPERYFLVELIALCSNLFLVILFVVWMRIGVVGVFWGGVGGSFFGMLLGLFFVRDKLGRHFSLALLAPMLLYAMPQLPGVLVNWIQSQAGRLFINYYTTLEQQGLYSIAFALGSIVFIFTMAFRLAYDPYSLSIMKRDDAKPTYAMFYSIYSFLAFVVLGGAVGFAKPALMVLTPPEYHAAHVMVFWIVGAAFLMGSNNILGTGIWITRRTAFTSYAQLCTFFTIIPTSFILVPKYQAVGAAMAYLLGALVQSIAYYTFAQRLYHIPYRYWRIHAFFGLSILIGWLQVLIVDDKSFLTSIFYGFVTFILISVPAYFIAFDKATRRHITGYIKDNKILRNVG